MVWELTLGEVRRLGLRYTKRWNRKDQCSEPSSPSVLGVGLDGLHRGSPSFFESMDDYGKGVGTGRPTGPSRAL